MTDRAITAAILRDRLKRVGHVLDGDMADPSPGPEAMVTVGANLDPTLFPRYRSRYFACYLKSPDEPVPVLGDDPEFALPETFRSAAANRPAADPFMEGPFRWLLTRLKRFDRVLLWPATEEQVEAATLDLRREDDCRVLWEAASEVSRTCSDLFVSDAECREVYRLHHHDKVVAAVLDDAARLALLDDLARRADLFEDCSGYVMDRDDDGPANGSG